MRNKKFSGFIALILCILFAFAGQGFAEEFGWPVPGYTTITTSYYYSSGSPHSCRYSYGGRPSGIDIAVPSGTQVLAPASGTVQSLADLGNSSFGKYFEIRHNDGTVTLYAHLSSFNVSNGQSVNRGDVIAWSGSTGNSTGPHLHFEMSNRDTYQYYMTNGCRDPRYMDEPETYTTRPTINAGLRNLSNSSYAKIFTLTSSRYTNLYSNSELTTRLSSTAWTGESDEIWITGVGWNSSNVPYARIKYPVGSSRREAYVSLREFFVKGSLDNGIITAKRSYYGLYQRLNAGKVSYYGIDAGDRCYALTYENGWYQVLYPVGSLWRIAWMPEDVYLTTFESGVPPPAITAVVGTNQAIAGVSYSMSFTATGTVTSWSTSNGTPPSYKDYYRTGLPPGLSINSSSGRISGTPAHTDAGKSSYDPLNYYFNVKASNSAASATESAVITVYEPPVITTSSSLPNGGLNSYYNQTIEATGTEKTMEWKLKSGSLPPGLGFSSSRNSRKATIIGYPMQSGTYSFEIQLKNLVGNPETTTTKQFTINVGNPVEYLDSRIQFTYNFYNAEKGVYFSDYVAMRDSSTSVKNYSNYDYTILSGTKPDGLSLSASTSSSSYYTSYIYLRGTPTTAKTYNFTIRVKRKSDGGYNTKNFNLTVEPRTPFPDPSMSTTWDYYPGKLGVSYRDFITVNGGVAPYTSSVISGTLPPGLSLETSGRYINLTGIPRRYGTFAFKLRITGDHKGYVDKSCIVTIANNSLYKSGAPASGKATKPSFSSKVLPNASVGQEWEATLEAYGSTPIGWYVDETLPLPEWLTLEEETGRLSGIPMEIGKYKFKIRAENEVGSTTKTLKLKVLGAVPSIATTTLPDGVVKVPYEVQLEATGTDPIKWSKVGRLPNGLKLNKKEGIIYGTPKKAGEYVFLIKAKNKAGTDTATLKIVISNDEPVKESEEPQESTSSANDVTNTGSAPETETKSDSQGSGAVYTDLVVISEDEEYDGFMTAQPETPLTFKIGEWIDEYGRKIDVSDVKVFVNEEPVDEIEISDEGVFVLSEDVVNGEFTVYASAQSGGREFKTHELNIVAGEQAETASETENDDASESNSSGGCNISFAGIMGIILSGAALFIKRKTA